MQFHSHHFHSRLSYSGIIISEWSPKHLKKGILKYKKSIFQSSRSTPKATLLPCEEIGWIPIRNGFLPDGRNPLRENTATRIIENLDRRPLKRYIMCPLRFVSCSAKNIDLFVCFTRVRMASADCLDSTVTATRSGLPSRSARMKADEIPCSLTS